MFRFIVVFATVMFASQCHDADAQGWGKSGFRGKILARSHAAQNRHHNRGQVGQRSSYPSSPFGIGISIGSYPGYGYSNFGYVDPYRFDGFGYDPYRYGTFRMYDPMDDPYFRERYRYDSQFPGRRR